MLNIAAEAFCPSLTPPAQIQMQHCNIELLQATAKWKCMTTVLYLLYVHFAARV